MWVRVRVRVKVRVGVGVGVRVGVRVKVRVKVGIRVKDRVRVKVRVRVRVRLSLQGGTEHGAAEHHRGEQVAQQQEEAVLALEVAQLVRDHGLHLAWFEQVE